MARGCCSSSVSVVGKRGAEAASEATRAETGADGARRRPPALRQWARRPLGRSRPCPNRAWREGEAVARADRQ